MSPSAGTHCDVSIEEIKEGYDVIIEESKEEEEMVKAKIIFLVNPLFLFPVEEGQGHL